MKRGLMIALCALLLLLLAGCGPEWIPDTGILVNIRESDGISVHNNGQRIQPGEDAVFLLDTKPGFAVVAADYEGSYYTYVENGQTLLTLENVSYSTHVTLELSDQHASVTYDANGGDGPAMTVAYDTTIRLRPNTVTADSRFAREGHTLESWNTMPDGTGERIGLGSRVGVPEVGLTLYAQWAKWTPAEAFDWKETEAGVCITGYHGTETLVVIPARIEDSPVTAISSGAFQNAQMTGVILPVTMKVVEDGAFQNCALETLTLFDNIETISDAAFSGCEELRTLRINAMEKPYGFRYRRESLYADKVELLIQAKGQKKIVFYAGCSMWYNLDGSQMDILEDQGYRVVNMGINGLASSAVQMQIMEHFLEPGDILFHTPEISSAQQMMTSIKMDSDNGDKLWCGLEYNYDLVTLVDLRTIPGVLNSFCEYLGIKKEETEYTGIYTWEGQIFSDEYGCVCYYRDEQILPLQDEVHMDPSFITETGVSRLREFYDRYQEKGVRIYISYACTNMDEVLEEEKNNVGMVEERYKRMVKELDGPVLISSLEDYLYQNSDFYNTNYHLMTEAAVRNTEKWLRDLQVQMEHDGLWEAP